MIARPIGESNNLQLPKGVMVALATPLDNRGYIDQEALSRLLDYVLLHPLTGICPVGSTGEGPLLSRRLRTEVTASVARHVPDGVWNIPAAVATTLKDVVDDLVAYADAGADAALVTMPFYYRLDSLAVAAWFEAVARQSPIPILLYNIPSFTKDSIPPGIVGELAKNDNIVGMKDSSRDMEYFESVLAVTQGTSFSLLTGSDTLLLASGLLGGVGTIAASANLVPEMVSSLWSAVQTMDWPQAREIQQRLLEVVQVCRGPGFPSGWKAAMSLVGLCAPNAAFPQMPIGNHALADLACELAKVGVSIPTEQP